MNRLPLFSYSLLVLNCILYGFFLFFNFILFLNFTIFFWFCQISKWIRHRYTRVPHPEPSSLLPPHSIPPGRRSSCSCLHSGPEWMPNWQIWKYFLNLQLSGTGNYWLKLLIFFPLNLDFFLIEPCYVHLVLPTISLPAFSLSLSFVSPFPLTYPLNIDSPSSMFSPLSSSLKGAFWTNT